MPLYKKRFVKPNNKPLTIKHNSIADSNKQKLENGFHTIKQKNDSPNAQNKMLAKENSIKTVLSSNLLNNSPAQGVENFSIAESPKESASFEFKSLRSIETEGDEEILTDFGTKIKNTSHKNRKSKNNLTDNSQKKRRVEKETSEEKISQSINESSGNLSIAQIFLLSQEVEIPEPPKNASLRERMEWLQNERNVGLYVQCNKCEKFRFLDEVKDPTELPEKWYCNMNTDSKYNNCDVPEEKISARKEEDLIYNDYNAGSVVWAKVPSYPWWPAMVDDDPDYEQYYWLNSYSAFPTHYHVTFFDSEMVSRGWVTPRNVKSFRGNENLYSLITKKDKMKFSERFQVAKNCAITALSMNLLDRLKKYSFLTRFPYDLKKIKNDEISLNNEGKKRKKQKNIKQTKNGSIKRKYLDGESKEIHSTNDFINQSGSLDVIENSMDY